MMVNPKCSLTSPFESSSSIWKLRASIAKTVFDSNNARLRPGQNLGPAPKASDLGARASASHRAVVAVLSEQRERVAPGRVLARAFDQRRHVWR